MSIASSAQYDGTYSPGDKVIKPELTLSLLWRPRDSS